MLNHAPLALISLAIGYKVFIDASKENVTKRRSFGRILGIFIMTFSFMICVAPLLKGACYSAGKNCAFMEKICPTR